MKATDIEDKIKSIVEFIVGVFTTLWSFLLPTLLVKRMKDEKSGMTAPYTFLTIVAFFGLQLWNYFFLKRIVFEINSQQPVYPFKVEQTGAEQLDPLDFVGIPSLENIITLTVPYVLISLIIARLFRRIDVKLKLHHDVSVEKLIIYFSGFFVLALPLIVLVSDRWINNSYEWCLIFVLPPYLFLAFWQSANFNTRPRHLLFMSLSSLFIPFIILATMYSSLHVSQYLFPDSKQTLSAETINTYRNTDLFKVKLIERTFADKKCNWKILLRSNDTDENSFQLTYKPGTRIYNEFNSEICRIESISGEMIFSTYAPTLLDVVTTIPDTIKSDYYFCNLSIINRTQFKVYDSPVKLWEIQKDWVFGASPKNTKSGNVFSFFPNPLRSVVSGEHDREKSVALERALNR